MHELVTTVGYRGIGGKPSLQTVDYYSFLLRNPINRAVGLSLYKLYIHW